MDKLICSILTLRQMSEIPGKDMESLTVVYRKYRPSNSSRLHGLSSKWVNEYETYLI